MKLYRYHLKCSDAECRHEISVVTTKDTIEKPSKLPKCLVCRKRTMEYFSNKADVLEEKELSEKESRVTV